MPEESESISDSEIVKLGGQTITVLRHAESIGNHAESLGRRGDESGYSQLQNTNSYEWPLTLFGQQQAQTLGEVSDLNRYDALIVSPMNRALETAHFMGPDQPWTTDKRLVERDYGGLENLPPTLRDLELEHYGSKNLDEAVPLHPSIEPMIDVVDRVKDFLAAVLESGATNVLVLTHGTVMHATRVVLEGLPVQDFPSFTRSGLYVRQCQFVEFQELRQRPQSIEYAVGVRTWVPAPLGRWSCQWASYKSIYID